MKMFKKYANLALLTAAIVSVVPAYSMETDEVTDNTEQIETATSVHVAWYKTPTAKYSALVATGLIATYAGTCWYKELSPMELAKQIKDAVVPVLKEMGNVLISFGAPSQKLSGTEGNTYRNMVIYEDALAKIGIAKKELIEKCYNEIALYNAFPTNDLSFANYVAEREAELLANITKLYEQYRFKDVVILFGDSLGNGTKNIYSIVQNKWATK